MFLNFNVCTAMSLHDFTGFKCSTVFLKYLHSSMNRFATETILHGVLLLPLLV